MQEIDYSPTIVPPLPHPPNLPFIQRIDLREGSSIIATAHWHAPVGQEGVAQLLDLTVIPEHRRKGRGSSLLTLFIEQAVLYGQATGIPIRRVWISVEQKTQVNARAFLTRHGFHHVSTIKELLAKQDALVYLRSLD
jgi:ribosomal protein S18 acetylase RimI-like enzyme